MRKIRFSDWDIADVASAYKFQDRLNNRKIKKAELINRLVETYNLDREELNKLSNTVMYLKYTKECDSVV